MRVLLTGGGGFIGRFLALELNKQGHDVRIPGRSPLPAELSHMSSVEHIDFDLLKSSDYREIVAGCDAIIHLAALAHVRRGGGEDVEASFTSLNVDVTERLAQAAAKQKCRFVFLSSIGVNGEENVTPFDENDEPRPSSHYAMSKLAAERKVMALSGLEWTIVRPPLVVGPGAQGNLGMIQKLLRKGFPFPRVFPGNRRALVGVRNLSAFIGLCLTHPAAVRQLFVIADEPHLSTSDLVVTLARGMGKTPLMLPMPAFIVKLMARFLGRTSAFGAFWKCLAINSDKAVRLLGWRQIHSLDAEIANAAQDSSTGGVSRRNSIKPSARN